MILYQRWKKLLKKQLNPIYISDKNSLNYEKGLGSDIAEVQKVDKSIKFYYYNNNNNNKYLDQYNNE